MEGLGHELLRTAMAAPGEAVFGTDSPSHRGTPRHRQRGRLVRRRPERYLRCWYSRSCFIRLGPSATRADLGGASRPVRWLPTDRQPRQTCARDALAFMGRLHMLSYAGALRSNLVELGRGARAAEGRTAQTGRGERHARARSMARRPPTDGRPSQAVEQPHGLAAPREGDLGRWTR